MIGPIAAMLIAFTNAAHARRVEGGWVYPNGNFSNALNTGARARCVVCGIACPQAMAPDWAEDERLCWECLDWAFAMGAS